MAALLSSHLEQISLCSESIGQLVFQGPKRFTNALLATQDITSLIRDTEQHERALFHLAPPSIDFKSSNNEYASAVGQFAVSQGPTRATSRRATMYPPRQPKNKAVAAVLGGDLYQRTRRADAGARAKGEVDVDLLLLGAEKLAAVYPIAGATDKIAQLRRRHHQLSANIAHYEAHVAQQARELQVLNRPSSQTFDDDFDIDLDEENPPPNGPDVTQTLAFTKDDFVREELEVRELERKKKSLEERVTGMERDLGGLMR